MVEVSGVQNVTLANLAVGNHDFGPMNHGDDIRVTSPSGTPCRLILDEVYAFGMYQKAPDTHGIHFDQSAAGQRRRRHSRAGQPADHRQRPCALCCSARPTKARSRSKAPASVARTGLIGLSHAAGDAVEADAARPRQSLGRDERLLQRAERPAPGVRGPARSAARAR